MNEWDGLQTTTINGPESRVETRPVQCPGGYGVTLRFHETYISRRGTRLRRTQLVTTGHARVSNPHNVSGLDASLKLHTARHGDERDERLSLYRR